MVHLRRLSSEEGFALVELLTVVVTLGIVLAGITGIYIAGVQAQSNLTNSFQAEAALQVGLDKLRLDVHLACSQTAQSATSVTLSEPPCDGSKLITWCTQGSGSAYGLFRVTGSACSGGVKLGDYLTGGSIFSYLGPNTTNTTPATGSHALGRLHLDMTVDANPADTAGSFHIVDDMAFRNSTR